MKKGSTPHFCSWWTGGERGKETHGHWKPHTRSLISLLVHLAISNKNLITLDTHNLLVPGAQTSDLSISEIQYFIITLPIFVLQSILVGRTREAI